MSNIEGIKWVANGEPNFYTLLSGKNWFGKLQLNGEMHTVAQEKFLNGLFPHLKEEASKSSTPLTPVEIIENEEPWQKLIRLYATAIGPTPTPEQALLLKYFKEAGNELPIVPNGDANSFHKAWRQTEIIFVRGLCCKDMVVWNLMHVDSAIWLVLEQMWPEEDS